MSDPNRRVSGPDPSEAGSSENDSSETGPSDTDPSETDPSEKGKVKNISLRPEDEEEIRRVQASWQAYSSPAQVLWDHLQGSLLPRIENGNYLPKKLAREVTGRASGPVERKGLHLRLKNWAPLKKAAQIVNKDLRRLEKEVAWNGTIPGVPFCHCGSPAIVRAAAREIAKGTRGGTAWFFSRGSALAQEGAPGQDTTGPKPPGRDQGGSKTGNQVLRKLPGRERGGKPAILAITAEAASRLKRKARSQNRGGSVLARRAIRQVIRSIEERPAEALKKIREESRLYEPKHVGDYRGFQVYVAPKTKRRLKRARESLREQADELRRESRKASSDRRVTEGEVTQGDILQAAARLAIESEALRPRPLGRDELTGQNGSPDS